MPTDTKMPKYSVATEEAFDFAAPIAVDAKIMEDLEAWITWQIGEADRKAEIRRERCRVWRAHLRGENPFAPIKSGMSNVNVPLMMWACAAMVARIQSGAIEQRPDLTIKPAGIEKRDGVDLSEFGKALADLLSTLIASTRNFDGATAMRKAAADCGRFGLGAWKILIPPPKVRRVPDDGGSIIDFPEPRAVRWMHIPFDQLDYCDGYGDDVAAMPFVGHTCDKTWGDILQWAALGYYYKDKVAEVEGDYNTETGNRPAALREHPIAELYCDYDIDGDGKLESVVIDYHRRTQKILRVGWNQYDGFRPIVLVQMDDPADLTDTQGQGVCEKLESPQQEANVIHNIGIEGGKRAIAHLTVIRSGSGADEELGGDETVLPGTIVGTEDPEADIQLKPLGDPRGPEHALVLEERNQIYVVRLLGLSDTSFGDVQAGKRVPAAIGVPTMREGRTLLRRVLGNFARAKEEAVYLSIQLMRRAFPDSAVRAVMKDEHAVLFTSVIFNVSSQAFRNQFIIVANAQDAAVESEEKKQELFALVQFLMTYYERLFQLVQFMINPQVPEPMRNIMVKLYEKVANGMQSLLVTLDSVKDPAEVLYAAAELKSDLDSITRLAAAGGAPAAEAEGQGDTEADFGAGVA